MANLVERRIQSNGNTVNFNIDRTQPSKTFNVNGEKTTVFGSKAQLDEFESQISSTLSESSNVKSADAIRKTFEQQATATFNPSAKKPDGTLNLPAQDRNRTQPSESGSKHLESVVPNALEQFASYSPLFTLASVGPSFYNNPEDYRNDPSAFSNIIFSSAGRFGDARPQTASGTPEFYIDNLEIDSFVTGSKKTGNSNAVSFTFDILEPYSVGLFLQSLQLAALSDGYVNYLDAVYVLKIDFVGARDDTSLFDGIKSKFFPLKFTKVGFDVDESGSRYTVNAFPYNHLAYSNVTNKTYTDVAVIGSTVIEALSSGDRSLVNVLNQREADAVKNKKQKVADQFTIEFPKDYSERISQRPIKQNRNATEHPIYGADPGITAGSKSKTGIESFGNSKIGTASLGFNQSKGGNFVFPREGDVIDDETGLVERNKMIIDPSRRQFQFPQGSSITRIINDIVLSSAYATDAITLPPNADGMVDWFKIDAQIELLDFDDIRQVYGKRVIFRVIPYQVHVSILSNKTSMPPYGELEKQIVKKFDYLYTGQNNNIIKYDIKIDTLFYTGLNPQPPSKTGSTLDNANKGVNEEPADIFVEQEGQVPTAQASATGGTTAQNDPNMIDDSKASLGSPLDPAQIVALNFQEAFLNNSADLIKIEFEVFGDPYWLVDNAMGNYFSPASENNKLITQDGTANFEGTDHYIYIELRTPNDVNPDTGLYEFSEQSKISPFSGIYKVVKCINYFQQGKYTQKLSALRMGGQAFDLPDSQLIDPESTLLYKQSGKEPIKTSTIESDVVSGYEDL